MAFLEWLQSTWVGLLVAESLWGYPLLETIHTIGMAMLIGSLGLINLRVLGVQGRPAAARHAPAAAARVARFYAERDQRLVAVHVGRRRTSSRATRSASRWCSSFLAGINAALLGQRVFREAAAGASAPLPTASTKWIAATSLVFWFGAVCAGRLVAYTP